MTELSGNYRFSRGDEPYPEPALREFFTLVRGQLDTLEAAAAKASGVVPCRVVGLDLAWRLDSVLPFPETGPEAMARTLADLPEEVISFNVGTGVNWEAAEVEATEIEVEELVVRGFFQQYPDMLASCESPLACAAMGVCLGSDTNRAARWEYVQAMGEGW